MSILCKILHHKNQLYPTITICIKKEQIEFSKVYNRSWEDNIRQNSILHVHYIQWYDCHRCKNICWIKNTLVKSYFSVFFLLFLSHLYLSISPSLQKVRCWTLNWQTCTTTACYTGAYCNCSVAFVDLKWNYTVIHSAMTLQLCCPSTET